MTKWLLKIGAVFISAMIIAFGTPSVSQAQFSPGQTNFQTQDLPIHNGEGLLKTYSFDAPLSEPLTFTLSNEPYRDPHPYAGMAIYLGMAPTFKVSPNGRVKTLKQKKDELLPLDGQWVGFKGRFKSAMVKSDNGILEVTDTNLKITWPAGVIPDLKVATGNPDSNSEPGSSESLDFRTLQYAHLPRWMRMFCRAVEWLYKSIASVTGLGWAISLVLLAIIIKLLMLPITNLTARFQREVNEHKAALEPILDDIKKNHKGETAHKKTMAAYKARNITPYFTLKPLLATLIGLPVLIAIFNMLGEVSPLQDSGFLWINSLAYPDNLAKLPFNIPLFGSALNVLPFLMTAVTVWSTYTLKNSHATPRELAKQKRNLYLMAAAFFIIFYPFPSGMVLYWTLVTAIQLVINRIKAARA